MNKKLIFFFLLFSGILHAYPQALPDNRDFTMETIVRVPGVKTSAEIATLGVSNAGRTIQYYDKFGRKSQTIGYQSSPTYKDIVQLYQYDLEGRELVQKLPYSTSTPGTGLYRPAAIGEQMNFFSLTSAWDPLTPNTTAPYSEINIEHNFLNTVKEAGNIGEDWQLGGGHTVRSGVLLNNNVDLINIATTRKVAKYTVQYDTNGEPVLDFDGYHADNTVMVKITKGEQWSPAGGRLHTSETYIDAQGRQIAVRTFYEEDNEVKIKTAYSVYDWRGQLVFTLPVALHGDMGVVSSVDLEKYAYISRYDLKGRQISAKSPAIDTTYYIYNKRGNLVASQTAGQRINNEWTFVKYDVKGRVIISGVWNNDDSAISREDLQTLVDASSHQWESRMYGTEEHSYSNVAWPSNPIVRYDAIQYYDEYTINGLPGALSFVPYSGSVKIDYPSDLPVASKTWADDNTILWTVNYYDQQGNLIQTQATNHLGGRDMVNNVYSFIGELTETERKHYDDNEVLKLTVKNTHNYDHVGRLLHVKQQINNQDEVTLSAYRYNELGQVVDKKLHQLAGQAKYLQSIDFRYNERGWLRSINDPDLQTTSLLNDGDTDSNPDLFGMQLSYNDDPIEPQYNGNIAATRWKTSQVPSSQTVAPPKMGYQYRYDALNRLTNAISEQDGLVNNAHDENISYDINGNITTLQRKAYTGGNIETIDDLVYTYDGYRTQTIDDQSLSQHNEMGYDGKAKLAIEHLYDTNGNMIEDKNKNITLEYNDRNLVKRITFGGDPGHTLEFQYDRTGKKLQAEYTYPTGNYTIDYLDGIQYQQGQLAFLHTGEGRARWNGTDYTYEYDLKDHLGNVRVTFIPDEADLTQTTARVIQQNSYYAYGMPMYGDAANGLHLSFVSGEKSKYLYSDKELYDQGELNWFDHGSRMYDPATGRWSVMDPAAQFANPYLAMGNNPALYVDPNGEWIHLAIGALIGGVMNWATNGGEFNAKGLGYFAVGALSGAAGAGVGAGVSSALAGGSFGAGFVGSSSAMAVGTGFMSSSVVGASAGAVGGFTLGFGNGLVGGAGIEEAFKQGAINGGIGALSGGLLGGLAGGIDAARNRRDFWTGAGSSSDYLLASGQSISGERYTSTQDMMNDYNEVIGKKDNLMLYEASDRLKTSVQVGFDNLSAEGYINTGFQERALGVIRSHHSGGIMNRISSAIEIAPVVKGLSPILKNEVFKHEFIHAYHYMMGLPDIKMYSERAASRFSQLYLKAFGLPVPNVISSKIGNYPSSFWWGHVRKLVPLWIKP